MGRVLEWVVHAADSRERKGCMGLMGTRAEGLGGVRGGGGGGTFIDCVVLYQAKDPNSRVLVTLRWVLFAFLV